MISFKALIVVVHRRIIEVRRWIIKIVGRVTKIVTWVVRIGRWIIVVDKRLSKLIRHNSAVCKKMFQERFLFGKKT